MVAEARHIPIVDIGRDPDDIAAAIDRACRDTGFFCVVGHDVPAELQQRLDARAREFFALDDSEKAAIDMRKGGRAWRGWFPVGRELTSGAPDQKEGIYFGAELNEAHPLVQAGVPLHGPNLFAEHPLELRETVLEYLAAMTQLGHQLAEDSIRLGQGI